MLFMKGSHGADHSGEASFLFATCSNLSSDIQLLLIRTFNLCRSRITFQIQHKKHMVCNTWDIKRVITYIAMRKQNTIYMVIRNSSN